MQSGTSSPTAVAVHPSVLEAANAILPAQNIAIERYHLASLDAELVLIGTNHMVPECATAAADIIRAEKPDCVLVELDPSRAGPDIMGPDVAAALSNHRVSLPPWMPPRGKVAANMIEMGIGGIAAAIALDGRRSFAEDVIAKPDRRDQPSSYGNDMRAAAEAAHEVGAQLVLGDRDIFTTLGRAGGQFGLWRSLLAAQTASCGWELSSHDVPLRGWDVARWLTSVLTKDWEGAAARLKAMAERASADAAAGGSYSARIYASHPEYAKLIGEERAAWLQLLVHGNAVSSRVPSDAPGAAAAAAGRAGLRALADRVNAAQQAFPYDAITAYFQREEEAAAKALADSMLTPEGKLRTDAVAAASGDADTHRSALVRARRAAAGVLPGGAWGPGVPAAMAAEREAILASSILHMRDRCEVAAAARAEAAKSSSAAAAAASGAAPLQAPADPSSASSNSAPAAVAPSAPAAVPAGTVVMLKPQGQSSSSNATLSRAADASTSPAAGASAASGHDSAAVPALAEKPLRFVAVVGLGHVPGIMRYLRAAEKLASHAAAHLQDGGTPDSVATTSRGAASNAAADAFDVDAARESLVAAGFLPAKPVRPLGALFPGQGLPGAAVQAPASAPSPAAAAAAAAAAPTGASTSIALDGAPAAAIAAPPASVARRALLRAVAACSVDEQIVPTLSLEPGHALKHAWGPLAAFTALAIAPFLRVLPRQARIAASVTVMAGAAMNLGSSLALRTFGDRISHALDGIDARLAAEVTLASAQAASPSTAAAPLAGVTAPVQ